MQIKLCSSIEHCSADNAALVSRATTAANWRGIMLGSQRRMPPTSFVQAAQSALLCYSFSLPPFRNLSRTRGLIVRTGTATHCRCCCLRSRDALIYRKCDPNRIDLFICINTLLTGRVTLTLYYDHNPSACFKCLPQGLRSEERPKQTATWMFTALLTNNSPLCTYPRAKSGPIVQPCGFLPL